MGVSCHKLSFCVCTHLCDCSSRATSTAAAAAAAPLPMQSAFDVEPRESSLEHRGESSEDLGPRRDAWPSPSAESLSRYSRELSPPVEAPLHPPTDVSGNHRRRHLLRRSPLIDDNHGQQNPLSSATPTASHADDHEDTSSLPHHRTASMLVAVGAATPHTSTTTLRSVPESVSMMNHSSSIVMFVAIPVVPPP